MSALSSHHRLQLGPVLKSDQLRATVFVVVVDLAQPWRVMQSVERWTSHLDALVSQVGSDLDEGELQSMRQEHFNYVQKRYASSSRLGQDGELPDLPEGMLEHNSGVPLIVVGCNSDSLVGNSRASISSQCRANFVQLHLRQFCLRRGAALVFVPGTAERMELLQPKSAYAHPHLGDEADLAAEGGGGAPSALLLEQYLLHRLYPATFQYTDENFDLDPMRRDAELFLASGQDSTSLQRQLALGDIDPDSTLFGDIFPANDDGSVGSSDDESKGGEETSSKKNPSSASHEKGGGGGGGMGYNDGSWLTTLKDSLPTANAARFVKSAAPAGAAVPEGSTAGPGKAGGKRATRSSSSATEAPSAQSSSSSSSQKAGAEAKDFFATLAAK
jgi:hypothetical protein